MKTAIQEAIDFVNELNDKDTSEFNYYHSAIIEKLNELLEKEKEQIIDFHVMLMKHGLEQEGNVTKWDYNLLKDEAEEYYNQTYNRTYNQKGIDAGIFLADLLTKELEELGDEDLEPREEVQNLGVDPVLRLKEDYDPNTINFRWNDTEEVILKISKEEFYYRGELVADIHNVYERFNEWLTKIE